VLIGIFIGGIFGYTIGLDHGTKRNINTFDECVAAGYPVQESYPEKCTISGTRSFTKVVTSQGQPTTLEGTVVCLTHRNTSGPQTLECAIGFKTNDNKYYGLHSDSPNVGLTGAAGNNKKFKVTGTLKLEADPKYNSEGVMTVSSFEPAQ